MLQPGRENLPGKRRSFRQAICRFDFIVARKPSTE